MSDVFEAMKAFVVYARTLDGDEKGEAQVFCDRLFQAFGHEGYKEAGASLEFRVPKRSGKGKSFADLVWKPTLLVEMKRSGEKLSKHYRQAFDYWLNAVPNRPRYVVLCNFNEFWIYDFDKQLDEPVDILSLEELPKRYTALNFLFGAAKMRAQLQQQHKLSLRDLYRQLDLPGSNPVRTAQYNLDAAVRASYGLGKGDPLAFLLALNERSAAKEEAGEWVQGPGLPRVVKDASTLTSKDCIG